jgi:hypothetical protein
MHTLGYFGHGIFSPLSSYVFHFIYNNSLIIFHLQNYVCRLSVVPLVPSDWFNNQSLAWEYRYRHALYLGLGLGLCSGFGLPLPLADPYSYTYL